MLAFIFLAVLSSVALFCMLHYMQDLGQSDKARKRRDSPPEGETKEEKRQFKTLIIGGSSSGLTMAATLEKNKLDYLVLEENQSCGEQWRHRFDRLHLWTIKETANLPGLALPSYYPVYPSKDQMADYYDACGHVLNVKTNTTVVSANFDPATQLWTVRTKPTNSKKVTKGSSTSTSASPLQTTQTQEGEREGEGEEEGEGEGKQQQKMTDTYLASTLVVCTGSQSVINMPDLPGRDKFTGQAIHSSEYKNGKDFAMKRVLVVGADSAGAEIALDLWEHDAKVTMVSSAPVIFLSRWILRPLLLFYPLVRLIPRQTRWRIYDTLGSMILGKSDHGIRLAHLGSLKRNEPLPSMWIDVGTLDLIRQNEIDVVAKELSTFTPNGVVFKDGKEAPFDAVIMNTGFKRTSYKSILEGEISKKQSKEPARRSSLPTVHDPPPKEGVEIDRKKLYFLGFTDEYVKLKEDHYTCNEILRDMRLKRYI